MAQVLIVYGSTEGHTALVAARMAEVIRAEGHSVEVEDARDIRKRLLDSHSDAVLVGGSIHAGDYQSSLKEFVRRNRDFLDRVPSAFFSVSLSAADPDEESSTEIETTVDKFVKETGWRPKRIEKVAGALVYTQYNIFIRHIMKLIVKQHGRSELDTSRDYDFTDWSAVEEFARDFARKECPQTV